MDLEGIVWILNEENTEKDVGKENYEEGKEEEECEMFGNGKENGSKGRKALEVWILNEENTERD